MQCSRYRHEHPAGMTFSSGRRPLIVLTPRPDQPSHGVVGPYLLTVVFGEGDHSCRH